MARVAPTIAIEDIFRPVTATEVTEKVKRIGNFSAAGVDGITKKEIKACGVNIILAKFFNILLMNTAYPAAWKLNRITLISKAGKDSREVKN